MRPALCLAVTVLAAGLTGCSSDGPTLSPVAATPSTTAPAPLPVEVTEAPTTPAATTPAARPTSPTTPTTPTTSSTTPSRPTTPAAQASRAPAVSTTAPPARTVPTAPPGSVAPPAKEPGLQSAPPPGLPTCRAAALTVTDADAVYTADAVQELFTIRTTGPDCQLQGYPTVSLRDEAGRPLPAQVRRNGYGMSGAGPQVVTLSRATSVSFSVATSRDGDCRPAATLVTTLPGSGAALTASTPMQVCDGAVGVTPVRRLVDDHELQD